MRKKILILISILYIFQISILNNPALAEPVDNTSGNSETIKEYHIKAPLQGNVSVNVPHTPEQVAKYLMQMRSIIDNYQNLIVNSLLGGEKGNKVDLKSVPKAHDQFDEMITKIRSTTPPAELKARHMQLADTLSNVQNYVNNAVLDKDDGLTVLSKLPLMVNELANTLYSYHTGVQNCLTYYGLSSQYDPFAGDHSVDKQRLHAGLNDILGQMKIPPPDVNGGDIGPYPSMKSGDLGSALGDLFKLLPNGLTGGLGNPNPQTLQQIMKIPGVSVPQGQPEQGKTP